MIYLPPTTRHFFDDPQTYGCMFSIAKPVGGQWEALKAGCIWMLDNGQFKEKWNWKDWWPLLVRLYPYRSTCRGIVIPDKLFDMILTLHLFNVYWHVPASMGFPVAFATQNGMTTNHVPWDRIDTLFIGGDDVHKRGKEAQDLALEAKTRAKWVHVGRCNSGGRYLKSGKVQGALLKHWTWADSADGLTLAKHPTQQRRWIENGVRLVNEGAGHQLILIDEA